MGRWRAPSTPTGDQPYPTPNAQRPRTIEIPPSLQRRLEKTQRLPKNFAPRRGEEGGGGGKRKREGKKEGEKEGGVAER